MGNLVGEVFALFVLKGKKWFYYGNVLLLLAAAAVLIISGLNLTAKRMSAIVPQLPEKALGVERQENTVYFDLLGNEFQVELPDFLWGDTGK